jgi:predicted phosphodiesterase
LLQKYTAVKIWLNGHNHAGNYEKYNGIHFVNFKGMVDTETENAFSIVTFFNNRIEIEGFGREKNWTLEF